MIWSSSSIARSARPFATRAANAAGNRRRTPRGHATPSEFQSTPARNAAAMASASLRSVAARRSRRPRFRFSAIRGKTKAFESLRPHGWNASAARAAHVTVTLRRVISMSFHLLKMSSQTTA